MNAEIVRFTGPLQVWNSSAHTRMAYLAITGSAARAISEHELIRRLELGKGRGFGSVKVKVTCGDSAWSTSVFPMSDDSWFLPMKAAIRKAEGLEMGDAASVGLELL